MAERVPAQLAWQRLRRNSLAIAGGVVVGLLIMVSLLEPWILPYDFRDQNMRKILLPPGSDHLMGTDSLGRDVLSRMIRGTHISLLVGFVAVGIATIIGTVLGSLAGYYSGWIDRVIMRFVDVMLSFPSFFLVLAVIALLEPSIWNIMVVIGLTNWMSVARLVRAEFLSLRERDYTLAARALGAGDMRIIFLHLESALSFLGLGVQPPEPSWGNILTEGKDNIVFAWWLSLFPGMAILITVLGYNLLGEGIRDAMDPRLRQ